MKSTLCPSESYSRIDDYADANTLARAVASAPDGLLVRTGYGKKARALEAFAASLGYIAYADFGPSLDHGWRVCIFPGEQA